MIHRKELWAILVVVTIGAVILVYIAARTVGNVLSLQNDNANEALAVDTSGWQSYSNQQFGFSFEYPQNWQISTAGISNDTPFIAIGNPLNGTSTYSLEISIENNSSSLSAGEYVHELLAADKADDAIEAKEGGGPQITPQFQKSEILTVGNYEAYELFNVFQYDRNAEWVYVANGNEIILFSFPIAQENPNISLPVANNAIVHEILNTVVLQK